MLRQYFNCNERLEIFLTCFCNILCYVGRKYAHMRNTITTTRILFMRTATYIYSHQVIHFLKIYSCNKNALFIHDQPRMNHCQTFWGISFFFFFSFSILTQEVFSQKKSCSNVRIFKIV